MIQETAVNINYSLITFKKRGANYELLFAGEALLEKLGPLTIESFAQLFPTLGSDPLIVIVKSLLRQEKLRTFMVLKDNYFIKVSIEGNVIHQEFEDSCLVNALIVTKPITKDFRQEWLLDKDRGQLYFYEGERHFGPAGITDLANYLSQQFSKRSKKEYLKFIEKENEGLLSLGNGWSLGKEIVPPGNFYWLRIRGIRELYETSQEIRQKMEAIIKETPNAVFLQFSPVERNLECFGDLESLLGYTPEEWEESGFLDWEGLVHPNDMNVLSSPKRQPRKAGVPVYSYYRIRQKSGNYIYVQETTRFFEETISGQKIYFRYIEDVSHMREFTKDFPSEIDKVVPNLMPCFMYIFEREDDGNQKIVFVSEGIKELFGVDAATFLEEQASFENYIHPEDLREIKQRNTVNQEAGQLVEDYFRIYTLRGKEKWMYSRSSPLRKSEGKDLWAGYILDISLTMEVEETNRKHFKQLKSIYDSSPLAIINFDHKGIVQSVNKTLLKKIDAKSPSQVVGKSITTFSSDEGVVNAFKEAFRSGKGEYEGPCTTDFNHKHFYVRLTVEEMEHVEGYQALFEDITEKEYTQLIMNNVAEISTRYSDKEFFNELVKLLTNKLDMEMCMIGEYLPEEDVVETISVAKRGVIMSNITYPLENTPCQKAVAKDQNDMVIHCERVCELYPEDDILKDMGIESYCSTGINDKSGKKIGILLLLDTKPIRNPKGIKDIITVLGDRVGADLQRIKNEEKLIESQQLYKSIAENFPKGTVDVLDRKYQHVYADGSEYKNMGIDPQELIGLNYLGRYDLATAIKAKGELQRVFQGETVLYEIYFKDQHYMKIGVPLTDDEGRVERILLVTQNITEAKKAEVEREKLIKDLSSHNDELQRFAYIVSHNLRAPIVNITSLLDLLDEEEISSPENQEVIDNLKTSVSILNATLSDLIEVVSIRKQKIIKVEEVFFHSLLNNIEKSLFKQLKEAKVIIHRDFQVRSINYVYSHLENFLLNFVTNAIKYSDPDRIPEIWVGTEEAGANCLLTFRDNGIGIDLEKYGNRIFGLYQRFHSHVEGKGLGLYLVREQIRSLDGDIEVESELDKGTTFKVKMKRLSLPAKKQDNDDAVYNI
ncbi:hypothetical protein GCM10028791_18930 [Echinicola sediminis]